MQLDLKAAAASQQAKVQAEPTAGFVTTLCVSQQTCERPFFCRGCVKTPAPLSISQHHSVGAEHEAIRQWR